MGITAEILEDGKILTALIARYSEESTRDNLISILRCLRDSQVWVPMNLNISDEDAEQFINSKKGDIVKSKDSIHLKPDILRTDDGTLFFPVFSQSEQMPYEYIQHFSTINLPFTQCVEMTEKMSDVDNIVVNAFTDRLLLDHQLQNIIRKLPSELTE